MGATSCCSVCGKDYVQAIPTDGALPVAVVTTSHSSSPEGHKQHSARHHHSDSKPLNVELGGPHGPPPPTFAPPNGLPKDDAPRAQQTSTSVEHSGLVSSCHGTMEDITAPPTLQPNPGGTADAAEKDDTHFQVKRVESKDERDFAHAWDLIARVLADLQVQEFGPGDTRELRKSQLGNDVKVESTSSLKDLTLASRTSANEGFVLNFPVTMQDAEALRAFYCRSGGSDKGALNRWVATELLQEFNEQFPKKYPCAVAEINLPDNGNVVVVGDTHGQLQDVLFIFHTFGPPSASNVYVFNGDVADRGPNSCEIFFLIFVYFLADPTSIVMNRGNHENHEMNCTDLHAGGGFRDEVLKKFNIAMYDKFQFMMRQLPLCTIIGKEVFVVHGGISEHSGGKLTLDHIRSIDHTEFCCPEPETAVVQEKFWIDLIWSDPTPRHGLHSSSRGAGARFGPDVTERFLAMNSPLRMIIRGHELPDQQRGYCKTHGGRVLTVFSASNYCGDTGNQGAVVVFKKADFPHYVLHEYFAPSLEMIRKLVAAGNKAWAAEGKLLNERDKQAKKEKWWPKELNKLMMTIVEMKPQIFQKYNSTCDAVRLVDYNTWVQLLSDVVGSHWHWEMAWKQWALGPMDSKIDFIVFLRRFTVVFRHDGFAAMKYKAIAVCFESILHEHESLKTLLARFDVDGSGNVTSTGLKKALASLDLGLTIAQIDSMLHILFKGQEVDGVVKMPVKEFLGRFTMVYKHAEDVLCAGERTAEERLCHDALGKIAHLISSQSFNMCSKSMSTAFEGEQPAPTKSKDSKKGVIAKLKEKKKGHGGGGGGHNRKEAKKRSVTPADVPESKLALKIERIFELLDTDHSGFIDTDHFVRGLWSLPGVRQIKLDNGQSISQDLIRRCGLLLDRSGKISILEFLEAFSIEDSAEDNDAMADALAEHMLAVLFRYRQAVRAGARFFDRSSCGKITEDQFGRVLHAVNKQIEEHGLHFSTAQIEDLCTAISSGKEGEQMIAYDEFFNSFEIVDAQNTALGVSISAHN